MNSLVLRMAAIARGYQARSVRASALQPRPARLRRKGPLLWAMLALLVLAADFLLAVLASLAVDLVTG
jgi:hypothetical protein